MVIEELPGHSDDGAQPNNAVDIPMNDLVPEPQFGAAGPIFYDNFGVRRGYGWLGRYYHLVISIRHDYI